MSSSGIQNYLSNVFRQVYVFDTTAAVFIPKLELSNIDTYSGNSVSVFTAAVGDAACNVYVGSNAGNSYNTIRACSNVTAVGYGAGSNISNVVNSTYMGFAAGANSSNANTVIAMGVSAVGDGISNIFIGNGTGTTGSSNIFLGHAITLSNVSNQVRIGHGNKIPIAADLSYNWVSLGGRTTPTDLSYATIDISGGTRIQGSLGIFRTPGGRTLDVNGNFRAEDGANILDFSNGLTRSSGGFASVQSDVSAIIGVTTIGVVRKGIFLVSAVDRGSSANNAAAMFFGTTLSNAVAFGTAVTAGTLAISTSTSNIQISNTTSIKQCDYSITYFPLP